MSGDATPRRMTGASLHSAHNFELSTLDSEPQNINSHTQKPPNNFNPQRSTLNPQPSTLNPQPSTLNPQPSTLNPKPQPQQHKKNWVSAEVRAKAAIRLGDMSEEMDEYETAEVCPSCEDPRPHARSMCAACFCPCVSQSRAAPLGRSRCQTSESLNTSEFPTELPTHFSCASFHPLSHPRFLR